VTFHEYPAEIVRMDCEKTGWPVQETKSDFALWHLQDASGTAKCTTPAWSNTLIWSRKDRARYSKPSRLEIRHGLFAASLASLNILKRLGGNEKTFGRPLIELAPDGIMKTPSYIWLLALLMLGNVWPSQSKG
jgi:hypothetical protein